MTLDFRPTEREGNGRTVQPTTEIPWRAETTVNGEVALGQFEHVARFNAKARSLSVELQPEEAIRRDQSRVSRGSDPHRGRRRLCREGQRIDAERSSAESLLVAR